MVGSGQMHECSLEVHAALPSSPQSQGVSARGPINWLLPYEQASCASPPDGHDRPADAQSMGRENVAPIFSRLAPGPPGLVGGCTENAGDPPMQTVSSRAIIEYVTQASRRSPNECS